MQKTGTDTNAPSGSKTQDRRAGTRNTIDKLVAERAEMLALYCRVAGLDPFKDTRQRKPAKDLLQEFCQVLVDYIAAGHFSLYERIAAGTERRRDVADLAAQLYPRIADSTQTALDFNDKYDAENGSIPASFHDDLSRLGEEIAARIELEDRLIQKMLG